VIQSFADRDTQELFERESNRRFSAIARVALRKLFQMNHAVVLADLSVPPPGNRLKPSRAISPAFTRFASMTSGASSSGEPSPALRRWPFAITIEGPL